MWKDEIYQVSAIITWSFNVDILAVNVIGLIKLLDYIHSQCVLDIWKCQIILRKWKSWEESGVSLFSPLFSSKQIWVLFQKNWSKFNEFLLTKKSITIKNAKMMDLYSRCTTKYLFRKNYSDTSYLCIIDKDKNNTLLWSLIISFITFYDRKISPNVTNIFALINLKYALSACAQD